MDVAVVASIWGQIGKIAIPHFHSSYVMLVY